MSFIEPLTVENRRRFVVFPIQYHDVWNMYKTLEKTEWNTSAINLSNDEESWNSLTEHQKTAVKHLLGFFAGFDGLVMENINNNFAEEIQMPEARAFYAMQMRNESVHNETYSLLISTYIKDPQEKDMLFNAMETMPVIKKMASWAETYMNKSIPLGKRLVAFSYVEGIVFSAAFAVIYWFNESGDLPGLCKANKYIARDESVHCEFAALLYKKYIVNKIPAVDAIKMLEECIELVDEYCTEMIPVKQLGLNAKSLAQYVRYVANRYFRMLGYKKSEAPYSDAENPFPFMEKICLPDNDDFFSVDPDSYAKPIRLGTEIVNEFGFNDDC